MSRKLSETKMSSLVEAQSLIREIGGPGRTKAALFRASMRLRTWTHNRIRDVYNADRRIKISADELRELQAAARANKIEDAKGDPSILELRAQIAAIADRLQRLDPEFHSSQIEALGAAAHREGDSQD